MLRDFRIPPLRGDQPEKVLIFLHGLGDRGDGGLLSLGQVWARTLPTTEFLCPDAPFAYDMAPPEMGGRQWFSLQDFDPAKLEAGVKQAAPILNEYIDHVLLDRGIEPKNLALVGFSQGTMMALYVAPRRAQQIACVVGYSGKLQGVSSLKAEKKSAPPVLLVHGTDDDVVPYANMAVAERELKQVGIPVETLTCRGFGHSIDDSGVIEGIKFLKKHMG